MTFQLTETGKAIQMLLGDVHFNSHLGCFTKRVDGRKEGSTIKYYSASTGAEITMAQAHGWAALEKTSNGR